MDVLLVLVLLLLLIGCAVAAVVWFTRRRSVGGGRGRVRSEGDRKMGFAPVEAEFERLKAQFESGALAEAELKAQLEELMIEDEGGRWWIIGYESGRWYVHDGEKWVQQDPPWATPGAPPTQLQHARTADLTLAAPSRPRLAPRLGRDAVSVLVITVGWLLSWWIVAFSEDLVIIGGIGGLITGLVLRRTDPPSPWKQVPLVTLGWAIGMAIAAWLLPEESSGGTSVLIAGAIIGLLGGLVTALALKWTHPSIQWKHVALVTLGWGIGWAAGGGIGTSLLQFNLNTLGGFLPFAVLAVSLWPGIGAAVGSWVMFWQLRAARQDSP